MATAIIEIDFYDFNCSKRGLPVVPSIGRVHGYLKLNKPTYLVFKKGYYSFWDHKYKKFKKAKNFNYFFLPKNLIKRKGSKIFEPSL